MAERYRSNDGKKETDEFLEGEPEGTSHQGRDSGDLARKTGTKAELRQAEDDRVGMTRVTKSDKDEPGTDNLGERNK